MRRTDSSDSDASSSLERELSDGAEAYLHGRYAEHLQSLGRPIPAWTWLNLLAHGTEAEIVAAASVAHAGSYRSPGPDDPRQALAFVADEVLDRAERVGSLPDLQRSVLVPLELRLVGDRESRWITTGNLVAMVYAALHGHPSAWAGRQP